jgi:hypothetical protein
MTQIAVHYQSHEKSKNQSFLNELENMDDTHIMSTRDGMSSIPT